MTRKTVIPVVLVLLMPVFIQSAISKEQTDCYIDLHNTTARAIVNLKQNIKSDNIANVAVKYAGGDITLLKESGITIVLDRKGDMNLRDECRRSGLKYYRIYNVFYPSRPDIDVEGPQLVSDRGEIPRGLHKPMVSPASKEIQQAKLNAITCDMQQFKPDGISLDFIRFHLEYENHRSPEWRLGWEEVPQNALTKNFISFSFDSSTLKRFQEDTAVVLRAGVNDSVKAAQEIFAEHSGQWTRWKCSLITNMVAELRKRALAINPDMKVMIHFVPWRVDEFDGALGKIVGQDPIELAEYVDIFAPMMYRPFLNRETSWIGEYTSYLQKKTGKKVWPCIQAMPIELQEHFDLPRFAISTLRADWLSAAASGTDGITLYGPSGSDTKTFKALQKLIQK